MKEEYQNTITGEEMENFRIVDCYCQQLNRFIRQPHENEVLGAAAVLRLILDAFIQVLNKRYTSMRKVGASNIAPVEAVRTQLRELRGNISTCLHYQGYTQKPATEESQLCEEALYDCGEIGSVGKLFVNTLCAFREAATRTLGVLELKPKTRQFKHLYSLVDGKAENLEKLHGMKPRMPQTGIEKYLASLCIVLEQPSRDNLLMNLSAAVAARLIAEKAGHLLIWRSDEEKGKNVTQMMAPELRDYLNILQKLPGATRNDELFYSRKAIEIIQREANRLLDWNWEQKKTPEVPNSEKQRTSIQQMQDNAALLCQIIAVDPMPDAVRELIVRREKNVEKLKQKYRRSRRWNIVLSILLGVSLPVLLTILIWYGINFTPRTSYFADYIWKNGMPVGIFELPESEKTGRVHYQFTTINGRVVQLLHMDAGNRVSNETLEAYQDRPAQIDIDYENRSRIVAKDSNGNGLFSMYYSGDLESITYRHPDTEEELYFPADMTSLNVYTWGKEIPDTPYQDIYSRMYYKHVDVRTLDGQERVVSFRQADEAYTDKNGLARLEYAYDEYGRIQKVKYHYDSFSLENDGVNVPGDSNTNRSLAENRLLSRSYSYDGAKLVVCEDVRADETKLQCHYVYDSAGNCVRRYFTDAQGTRIENKDGIAEYIQYYEDGLLVFEEFRDATGETVDCGEGYSSCVRKYDEQGRILSITRFDENGQLVTNLAWAIYKCDYVDNKKTESYYDASGKLLNTAGGYAVAVTEQDDNVMTVSYYDRLGNMVLRNTGAYQYRRTILEDGACVQIDWLDRNGNLMLCNDGYATIINRYQGTLLVSSSWYDAEGNPVNLKNGYCAVEHAYNAKRQNESSLYRSITEKYLYGYNLIRNKYTLQGRIQNTRYLFYDQKQEASVVNEAVGYSAVSYSYEDSDVIQRYFDSAGNRMYSSKEGCAGWLQTIDEKGRVVQSIALDINDMPMMNDNEKYITAEYLYEPNSDQHKSTIYTVSLSNEQGIAVRHEVKYDDRGREVIRRCLDSEGNTVVDSDLGYAYRYTYWKDNEWSLEYRDENDQPMNNLVEGCCMSRTIEDDEGRAIEWYYYDVTGKPAINLLQGYHGVRQTYDKRGNVESWTYLDINEEPMIPENEGSATVQRIFDERNLLISVTHHDVAGKLMYNAVTGYASKRLYYDVRGNNTKEMLYDTNGRCVGGTEWRYDAYDQVVQTIHLDETGAVEWGEKVVRTEHVREVHSWNESASDTRNTPIDKVVLMNADGSYAIPLDADGNEMNLFDVWFDEEEFYAPEYDEEGKLITSRQVFYLPVGDGGVMNSEFGAAGAELRYDEETARLTELTYLDSQGRPMFNEKKGCVRVKVDYFGEKSFKERYLDADNQPAINPFTGSFGIMRVIEESPFFYSDKVIYLDAEELPAYSEQIGAAIVEEMLEQNEKGETIYKKCFFDERGKPMLNTKWQYFCYKEIFDDQERTIFKGTCDVNDRPMIAVGKDYAYCITEYHHEDHVSQKAYYDEKGELIVTSEGYASVVCEYDEQNQQTGVKFYGADGQLVIPKAFGYAQLEAQFDDDGTQTLLEFLDCDGELIVNPDVGFARRTVQNEGEGYTYSCYGAGGIPIEFDKEQYSGAYSYIMEYYPDGSVKKVLFLDIDGNPCALEGGFSSVEWIQTSWGSYAIIYDAQGCRINNWPDGLEFAEPVSTDSYGKNVSQLLQIQDRDYASDMDVVFEYYEYAEDGSLQLLMHMNKMLEPVMSMMEGFASLRISYEPEQKTYKYIFYDEKDEVIYLEGKGFAMCRLGYDENDKQTYAAFYDEKGNLTIPASYGYAIMKKEYTLTGLLVYEAYYDKQERLMILPEKGYAAARREYDDAGLLIYEAYYDDKGGLMILPSVGYAAIRMRYSEKGQLEAWAYYNEKDQLMILPKSGYAAILRCYDVYGNISREEFYDEKENLMIPKNLGYAAIDWERDENGWILYQAFFDETGHLMIPSGYDYAAIRWERDEQGRAIYEGYYDTTGMLAKPKGKDYAILRIGYENDRQVYWGYFDENDQPVMHMQNQYAYTRLVYDENGQLLKQYYYDEHGEQIER